MRAALSVLGVRAYDEEAAIAALVAKIKTQKVISRNDHLAQMRSLLEWFRAGKISDFAPFSGAPIFLDSSEVKYRPPAVYYIDVPIRETGLKTFFIGSPNRHALWSGYVEQFDGDLFAAFAEKAGVVSDIPIRKVATSSEHPDSAVLHRHFGRRRTDNEIDRDWVIDGLDELLRMADPAVNKVVWDGMGRAHPRVLQACYRPNSQYSLQSVPSSLVYALRDAPWVLTKGGSLRCPRDVSEEMLDESWHTYGSNGWLTAVNFGASAAKLGVEQDLRAQAAQQLGITPELVEELHALSPLEQEEVLAHLRESKASLSSKFPSDDSPASETRPKRAEVKAREAPAIKREVRERSLRISSDKGDVRIYLAEKYSKDGRLFCQMSHEPMPFDLPSGGPFFEAVEFVTLETENVANYLCLSPICAAEFKHALQTDDESLRTLIQSLDVNRPEEQLTIQIAVPLSQHRTIRFRRSHLIDLQAALRVSMSPRSELL